MRIVCDDIRKHSTLPGRKNLSKIASMIVAKHKESFCDIVGDTVVGSGYESESLFASKWKNAYLI